MGYYAGIDIGSTTTKCVIVDHAGDLRIGGIVPTGRDLAVASTTIIDRCLDSLHLMQDDLGCVVTTGNGRYIPSFGTGMIPEIEAIGRGIHGAGDEASPATGEWPKLILDMGGHDCKALLVDGKGKIVSFATNGRCAAGTGRFMEYIGKRYGLSLQEMSDLAFESDADCDLTGRCGIVIASEMNRLVRRGERLENVMAGLFDVMLGRILGIIGTLRGNYDTLYCTGGVAQNEYLVSLLRGHFEQVIVPAEPQLVCARGAAIHALMLSADASCCMAN